MTVYGWSPDAKYLIVGEQHPDTGLDIEILGLSDRQIKTIAATPFNEVSPTLSPDGKWLAYFTTEAANSQVFVTPFPSGGPRWQASTQRGAFPRWSSDGKKLYFVSDLQSHLAVVDFRGGPAPDFGSPRTLPIAGASPITPSTLPNYVTTAGDRIVSAHAIGDEPPHPVNLITNWTKLLPR